MTRLVVAAAIALLWPLDAFAQGALAKYTSYDGSAVSVRFSTAFLVDFNAFTQDETSKSQVGTQNDEWDLRTLRLMFRGRLKFHHPVDYFVSLEVKGQDHVQTGASKIGFTDLSVSTELGRLGTLVYGKIKEPFAFEMVGDAVNMQQQERALSPFFASRGIGLRLTKPFAHDAMTWSAGWFNDWYVQNLSFRDSGNNFAARLTGVPVWRNGGADYLHLAVSARHVGADDGLLRFRGRPESNVTDYYVDTGELKALHANELGGEAVIGHGPWLVGAETARNWVSAPASDNPRFWGTYIVASYALTGEHRPYDRKVAYTRRLMPEGKWGAWEIVGRYSHVDVSDRRVDGGIFDRETAGLNWWATGRVKFGVDYGLVHLQRGGVSGLTTALHTRIQLVY